MILRFICCQAPHKARWHRKASGSAELLSLASIAFALIYSSPTSFAAATQLYNQGDPLPEEQYMLQLVNRARNNPAAEAARFGINLNEGLAPATISTNAKQPLCFNPQLLQAARDHSKWMIDYSFLTHVETNGIHSGADPGGRMQSAGYVFSGSWTWGENVAWRGQTGSAPPVGPTVGILHQDLFVDSYASDRGHRVNLLNASFREVGLGVKTGPFRSGGITYNAVDVTEDFAASGSSPGPFIVGVIYRDTSGDGFYTVGEGVSGVTIKPSTGLYYALSSPSGGYAIPITGLSGTVQITFSGGPLVNTITKSVTLTGINVELDFELNQGAPTLLAFIPGTAKRSANGKFDVDIQGPSGSIVTILASTNLNTWSQAGQATLTGGQAHFTETSASGTPRKFYRAVGQ
jgi:uncharacterized protein YkwD